eukprot:3189108-Prymnesium_polylepis.1
MARRSSGHTADSDAVSAWRSAVVKPDSAKKSGRLAPPHTPMRWRGAGSTPPPRAAVMMVWRHSCSAAGRRST